MPKNEATNHENLISLYRELLKTVDIDDVKLADQLEGDARRDFCKFCSEVAGNQFFEQVIQGFFHSQAMMTADESTTADHYYNAKLTLNGMHLLRTYFRKYANIYAKEYMKGPEPFDPFRSFEPVRRQDI